ncbi:hypothetical protein JCM17960_01950 [Magnetospira thiophila]
MVGSVGPSWAEPPFKAAWGVACDQLSEAYGAPENFTLPLLVNNKPRFTTDFFGLQAEVRFTCLNGGAFKVGKLGVAEVVIDELEDVRSKSDEAALCQTFVEGLTQLYGLPLTFPSKYHWTTSQSFVTLRCARKGNLIDLTYDSKLFFNDKGLRIN